MQFSKRRSRRHNESIPKMLLHAWIIALVAVVSSANLLIEAPRIPFLVWTSSNPELRITGMYSAPALTENQQVVMGRVATDKIASLQYPHLLAHLSSNDVTNDVTAVDLGRGNIVTFNMPDRSLVRHHGGVSSKVGGIAVDWSNGNIYWTDEGRHWIVVAKWSLKRVTSVVSDVAEPKGIALYSRRGFLFWSQVNQPGCKSRAQIMRSTLSGKDQKRIADTTGTPTSLAVDYILDKLYWIDSATNSIVSVDINGWEKTRIVYSRATSSFKGLALYKAWIFSTDFNQDQILMINKTNGVLEHTVDASSPYGVTVTGGDAQPYFSGPCDIKNGGCQEFCFALPPGNVRQCRCAIGMQLAADGESCLSRRMDRDFFVVVDSDMHWIFQVSKDGNRYARLDLPGINIPVQVEFDAETKMVYWTDVGSKSVNSAKWDGTDFKILAKDNVKQPTGLALDTLSGNLYWTDEGTGTINVVRVDGTHRKTLLSENVKSPRALAIDPFRGLLWWSDWTTKTIEMASMDGTNRKVILSEGISWPNGIVIDHNDEKLYWCDAHTDAIYVSNMDGSNKETFKRFSQNIHLFGIAVDDNYVYWTDWNDHSIMRVPKDRSEEQGESFGPKIFNKLCDIQSFVEDRNITAMEKLKHPCRVKNGDCTGLCLPVPPPEDHFSEPFAEESMLERVCMCGDDLSGSCIQPQIAPVDTVPPSFNGTCPTDMVFEASACSDTVNIEYETPTAFDDSGRVVLSKTPEGTPPVMMKEGRHKQAYTAIDSAGNSATCRFTITVKVVRCPNARQYVKKFDNIQIANLTCGSKYGSSVDLKCVNGTKIMITDRITCGADGKWKGHPVCYRPPVEQGPKEQENEDKYRKKNGKTIEISEHSTKRTTSHRTKTTVTSRTKTTRPTSTATKARGKPHTIGHEETIMTMAQTTKGVPATLSAPSGPIHPVTRGKFRSTEIEVLYLAVPAVVVIIVVILAAIGYKFCKSRNMPLIESMEKRLTFFNLKEADGERDIVAFAGDTIMQHQQRSHSLTITNEPIYADVHRSACDMTDDEINAITPPRRLSLPVETIYAEPEMDLTQNMSGFTTVSSMPAGGYGTLR